MRPAFVMIGLLALSSPTPASAGQNAAAAGGSQAPAGQSLPAGDVSANEVKAFIDKLPKDAISDLPIKAFDVGSHRVTVYGVFRPKSLRGEATLHETRTSETYYMLEGTATLVTGGTLADLKPRRNANDRSPRAQRIDGGVSRKLGPGDIVVIPGGTPHWWSSLDSDLRYVIIRSAPGLAPVATAPALR